MVVVLPTPPFWLVIETTRAGPCWVSGCGSGRSGIGRPVGPMTEPIMVWLVAAASSCRAPLELLDQRLGGRVELGDGAGVDLGVGRAPRGPMGRGIAGRWNGSGSDTDSPVGFGGTVDCGGISGALSP